MDESQRQLYLERDYLHQIGISLNAALFIVDRLTEEIKEEEGRLETDSEIERLFHHLADYLLKIDSLVKTRNTHLSEILNEELEKGKTERSRKNSPSALT
ncbi:hypothetical protein AZI87_11860 [Bdellovibrio bacteriovorus]|uniref:Uncharacterized protein n=1 Tax=Bdellovibrio bacteriovorus TaxID=959 RepID=A0A161PBX1_BDEBC|nr:hypothetical protein [Bdellovibrio bacteriovorus]KYG65246.1 hypothetical protein AZI87_11860 [Bdellovibrio bacteriovorus]